MLTKSSYSLYVSNTQKSEGKENFANQSSFEKNYKKTLALEMVKSYLVWAMSSCRQLQVIRVPFWIFNHLNIFEKKKSQKIRLLEIFGKSI
jgi:hypothetical protein